MRSRTSASSWISGRAAKRRRRSQKDIILTYFMYLNACFLRDLGVYVYNPTSKNRKELIMMNPMAMVALGATASIPIAGDSAILRSHEMRCALLLVHYLSDQESEASTELREHDLWQPHDPTAGVDVSPVPPSLCPASRGLSRTLPVKIVHFHFSY